MKVLLIDELPLMRQAERLLLQELFEQAEVIDAGSGKAEELERCDANCIDLVILGMQSPGEGQFVTLSEIVARFQNAPAIVLSPSSRAEDIAWAMRSGARGYLTTSSKPEALRHVISLVMAGETFFPAPCYSETPVHPKPAMPMSHAARQGQMGDVSQLTQRQIEVLRLLSKGQSNKQIARELGIYEGTVKAHLRLVTQKLGTHNRTELALLAARLKLFGSPGHGDDLLGGEDSAERPRERASNSLH